MKIKTLFILALGLSTSISHSKESKRTDFFKNIMGVTEQEFKNNKDKIRETAISFSIGPAADTFLEKKMKKLVTIKNNKNKKYQAGYFEELSVKDLRKNTKEIDNRSDGTGKLNIIERLDGATKPVNVAALQAKQENQHAVFQVASNFNGLEFMSHNGNEMQKLEDYPGDPTQGPAASISAAPGTILRQYYVFHDTKPENYLKWAQTKDRQIDFLDKTSIPTQNGYADLNNLKLDEINQILKVEDIKIGYQGLTQVTFGNYEKPKGNQEVVEDKFQIINQVFTAAINIISGSGGLNKSLKNDKNAQSICQKILEAAYEGTLRAAALKGREKVFLTLIGGAAFANEISWIEDAIIKQADFIKKSGLDVTVVLFQKTDLKKLKKLVPETGGSHIQYSAKNPDGKILIKAKDKKTEAIIQKLSTALASL